MNKYTAFYAGQRVELEDPSAYAAQQKAVLVMNVRKSQPCRWYSSVTLSQRTLRRRPMASFYTDVSLDNPTQAIPEHRVITAAPTPEREDDRWTEDDDDEVGLIIVNEMSTEEILEQDWSQLPKQVYCKLFNGDY